MDWLIELLDVLIWPLMVGVILFTLRRHIKQLLPLIQKIKYKDVEIEFTKRLEQVSEDVGELAQKDLSTDSDYARMIKLVDVSTKSAIIESWKGLEVAARAKVKQLRPPNEKFNNPLKRPLAYLDYKGAIHSTRAGAIRELHSLRNAAAHADGIVISKEDALEYVNLAKSIQTDIENIEYIPEIKHIVLTSLILHINHVIDTKKYDDISVDEVYGWIKAKIILPSLASRVGDDIDLSLFLNTDHYSDFVTYYHEELSRYYDAYGGDHRRKWGVENLGLCLLVAWTNEMIQQGTDWRPCQD